jgi:N-acetylglutamate synthase-like GNAT family acetyltransferase
LNNAAVGATTVLRLAERSDVPAISRLIDDSVRSLSQGYYSAQQVESSLRYVFGADTRIIADRTYYIVESAGRVAAAGGWSFRETLYGGDQMKGQEDPRLDPAKDAARIRAFFVHPDFARRGLGRALYDRCVADALAAGFRSLELMSTLPGEPLYRALGFVEVTRLTTTLPDGVAFPVVQMRRAIP